MKGPWCIEIVLSVLFVSTNEQCLPSVRNNSITSCDGSTKSELNIYIDFFEINRPCTCTVTSFFAGELLVTSRQEITVCYTQIYLQNGVVFRCQEAKLASEVLDVHNNESVDLRAEYESPDTQGTFYHCIGFQRRDGLLGNLSVTCGSPSDAPSTTVSSKRVSSTTLTSTQLSNASSPLESSVDSTSVLNNIENTDVTVSSSTINVSYDSLTMESAPAQDDQEMLYIIAVSAAGGAIILIGLIVLVLVFINRTKSARDKNGPTEGDMEHTNKVFDSNAELPDNPLYLASQPVDELGYNSDQEKQLGLPPMDSRTKKKINSDYDVPPNNKPIDQSGSSMPVYAVPKRSKDRTPEISSGNVYAEVCKPNRSTAKDPVRKSEILNEDGLLYMEVKQDTVATKQTNTNDKNKITEGVCYAEIMHT